MTAERPWLTGLKEASAALQGVLGALLEAERRFAPFASPLERLTGGGGPAEQQFLEHYRGMLQTDPAIAMAHAAALSALKALPLEAGSEADRLHARHQWNERRRFLRMGPRGRGSS
jgi:hypothetical protein